MHSPTRPPFSNDGDVSERNRSSSPSERPLERGNPQPQHAHGAQSQPRVDPSLSRAIEAAAQDTLPSWLRPFTYTPTTRFTRTPDYLRRPRQNESEAETPPSKPAAAAPTPVAPTQPTPTQPVATSEPRATEPAARTVPAAPAAPMRPVRQQAQPPAPTPPPSVLKVARMIRTDVVEPPQRNVVKDERPPLSPIEQRRAAARAAAAESEIRDRDAVAPSIVPIEAPLRASVRVSFNWPVAETSEASVEMPIVAAVQPAPVPAREPEEIHAAEEAAPVFRREVAYADSDEYEFPPIELLAEPPQVEPDFELSEEALNKNSVTLQQTLRDFGIRGEIIDANPGPVVTLYELEPAPGTKSSRVIALSSDISRSMSAISARVAVVEGRNVIGIELPNVTRQTVWLRELLESHEFADSKTKLGLCLGKTIGGEPVIVDLAKMPHLLVAGTTGSGKSVAINTMILSLLYQYRPEDCRLIMIDPKMLELSVYDGIPHLLTPVVTDPRKAVVALKWAVREMEERYKKMSRLGVRNIDGFNARVAEAREKGEVITRQVATGFDKETGDQTYEEEVMDLSRLPYIVVIVDEMADLMMVAGKDIEGAIQRLAQMARAAGIHIVMATQRPSVDVITGTIKANFPTRISFQVTSKIDSRTILGEMGAEQLLGQGDMLYMAGGGRIQRVHGPFVSDHEVEQVVAHLKRQARPEYLDEVTHDEEELAAATAAPAEDGAVFDKGSFGDDGADLYDQAIAIVLRDRKASTSYIQRRLQIGYNKAASIMERMEQDGIVGQANHAGKREILRNARDN
ncbi:S-DNA-T family DNA segregation ATPase FtsK/SpoIIIE [Kaistia hirudinis]|uniref:S-DNA-T family DNA segregation ATPase FtsK/SpoIIIE n=1 Tax=Kaistia hirudinis TaxID=1293440 RepID=A0A840ALS1_9HYPH|nr:DNA translocase FtsK [Kaistia hirudinis]MBB3930298.1 S-DNA-T family DNA segregation ATPase FtsK/SpoIIIE [Kaistia hirudinis]